MPFADSKNFDDCVQKRMKESNYDKETATKVCGKMKAELEKGSDIEEFEPSPTKKDLKEIGPVVKGNSWEFNPEDILKSKRKVTGTFHVPKVDKDRELITKSAMNDAIPDFMHLPILHDFHKERVLGVITRVWEEADSFHFDALFKATSDVDDAWNKVQKGEYDHVSIFGARLKGNASCGFTPDQRAVPCVSDKIRLDSISACDENARNDSTSMTLAKGEVEFIYETETIIKALNTDSNIVHGTYDGVKRGGENDSMRVKEVSEKDDKEEENEDEEAEGKKVEKCDCEKSMLHKAKESLKGIYSMIKELQRDDKKMVAKDEETHKKMEKADDSVGGRAGIKEYHSHDNNDKVPRAVKEFVEPKEEKKATKRFTKSKDNKVVPKITEEPAESGSTSQNTRKEVKEVEKAEPERTTRMDMTTKKVGAHTVGLTPHDVARHKKPIESAPLKKGDTMTEENVIEKANLEQTDEQFVEEIVKANMKSTDEIVKASVTAAVDEIKKAFEGQLEELKKELKAIKEQPMVKAAILIPDGGSDQPLNYSAIENFMKR